LKNDKKIIFIRVDSSTKIGYGHLIRCLALADTLKKSFKINFICTNLNGNLISQICKKNFEVFRFNTKSQRINVKKDAEKTISIIKKYRNKKSLLILDSYILSQEWENRVRPYVKRLIVIDDLMDRKHSCDLIIDQNLHTQMNSLYINSVPKNCVKLLGPDYAILRNQFIAQRKYAKIRSLPLKNILVSFGGSDNENHTLHALTSLKKLNSDVNVNVVTGTANIGKKIIKNFCKKNFNYNYFEQVENMAKLMQVADLCIGSSGTTTWERCCVGLPAIAIVASNDQKDIASAVSKNKCIINLGKIKKSDNVNYVRLMKNLKNNELQNMSRNCMKLVDGKGAARISKYIFSMMKGD
tara:strand:+ start:167 stop:1228 length:1062 start_codon:yes stop_codon:yes gene_type:complete